MHGLERGADGDLGFAETDVAADEAVHGFGAFHVGLGLGDGAHLVGRLLVEKRALEFALPGIVSRERVARLRFARGLDGEQFAGDIADGALGLGLGFGPTRAAEQCSAADAPCPRRHIC